MDIKYFDNAATTSLSKEVLDEMLPYLKDNYGNASAIYSIGRDAKKAVEDSRKKVANAINANEKEIYFTASGSEADNTAIRGIAYAYKSKGSHIITSKIEHPAVLNTCKKLEKEGFEVTYIGVDKNGIIDLEELKNSIKDTTSVISIMFANNEIGTIEPIKEIAKIAKEHGVIFHTDAVQAVGNVAIDVKDLGIDALSMSAHKFHGPKGVGALYVSNKVKFEKLIEGGHQERNKRAGTENVAGIVGIGKAIEIATKNLEKNANHLKELRDYYIKNIEEKIKYVRLNGDRENRLPGNANISFRFIEGESLLLNLDLKGICASSGSACTSGSLDPSHVLLAIGLPHEIAHGSLRISFGTYNTKEDVDYLIDNLVEIITRLRNMSPLYEDFEEGRYKLEEI